MPNRVGFMANLEDNKELARQFFEQIWNQGYESDIDRFIAEDAAGNDPKFGVGRESFRLQWRKWREGQLWLNLIQSPTNLLNHQVQLKFKGKCNWTLTIAKL